MLSGIHPILAGELLAALDRLGHGDELVERTTDARLVVHTGELPTYGNLTLRKAVVNAHVATGAAR